jgi:hypothetical protein
MDINLIVLFALPLFAVFIIVTEDRRVSRERKKAS